jgi:hypothetical protein
MNASKATATIDKTSREYMTRSCKHAVCWRESGSTFKTPNGRKSHIAMHTTKTADAPVVKNTPTQEEDRELRGPASKRPRATRRSKHADGVSCMNTHTGTHSAWLNTPTSVVKQAEAVVEATPATSTMLADVIQITRAIQIMGVAYEQHDERIDANAAAIARLESLVG